MLETEPSANGSTSVEFWAVIGSGGSGKSSIIRALTGVGNVGKVAGSVSERWRVSYHGRGTLPTFVQGCSLQEVEIDEHNFISRVAMANANIVIVAIQPNGSTHQKIRFPGAQAYVDAFVSAGWAFNGYATVGPVPPLIGSYPIPLSLHGLPNPANQEASTLRRLWGLD